MRLCRRHAAAFVFVLVLAAAPASAQRARRDPPSAKGKPAPAPVTADTGGKKYTFNSRFYRVTTDLSDKAQANDIAKLFQELRVVAELEGPHKMRLKAVRPPDAMNERFVDTHALGE